MEVDEDIVIVGAGIAGLTTSLGLHKYLIFSLSLLFCVFVMHVSLQFGLCTINMIIKMMRMFWRLGIRSLVLESSDELRTAGYALTLWTNAWKALDAVGIGDSLRLQHELLDG